MTTLTISLLCLLLYTVFSIASVNEATVKFFDPSLISCLVTSQFVFRRCCYACDSFSFFFTGFFKLQVELDPSGECVEMPFIVLASENWCMQSNTCSIRNTVVDEGKMMSGHWLWSVLYLPLFLKSCFTDQLEEEN